MENNPEELPPLLLSVNPEAEDNPKGGRHPPAQLPLASLSPPPPPPPLPALPDGESRLVRVYYWWEEQQRTNRIVQGGAIVVILVVVVYLNAFTLILRR